MRKSSHPSPARPVTFPALVALLGYLSVLVAAVLPGRRPAPSGEAFQLTPRRPADGPTSPEPAGPSLASWPAPAWSTQAILDDGAVRYVRAASTPARRQAETAGAPPEDVLPEAFVTDEATVTDGQVTVRRTDPVVIVDGQLYDVDQARTLALGILEVVAAVGGAR